MMDAPDQAKPLDLEWMEKLQAFAEHQFSKGQRVRSVFDDGREGVVVESNPLETLIEFENLDDGSGDPFTHRIWLPTRHWAPAPDSPVSGDRPEGRHTKGGAK